MIVLVKRINRVLTIYIQITGNVNTFLYLCFDYCTSNMFAHRLHSCNEPFVECSLATLLLAIAQVRKSARESGMSFKEYGMILI